jgi:hypothetical protein
MQLRSFVVSGIVIVCLAGCHRSPPAADVPNSSPQRTVFNDSLLHAGLCLPVKAGEDWHRVCTPFDQSARPLPKPAAHP